MAQANTKHGGRGDHTGESLWVWGQYVGIHSEFQASQTTQCDPVSKNKQASEQTHTDNTRIPFFLSNGAHDPSSCTPHSEKFHFSSLEPSAFPIAMSC